VNTLPCGGDDARQVVLVLVQQVQELEQHAGAADRRRVGPVGKAAWAAATASSTSAAGQATRPVTAPVAGLYVLMAIVAAHALVVDVVLEGDGHGNRSQVGSVGTHDRLSVLFQTRAESRTDCS
jgi:hypothetical protein